MKKNTTFGSVSVTAAMPSKPNGGREVPNLCCDGEAAEILGGRCFEDLVIIPRWYIHVQIIIQSNSVFNFFPCICHCAAAFTQATL